MKVAIRPLKKTDAEKVAQIYSEVIHPSYISYGEIAAGLAHDPKKFSDRAVARFERDIRNTVGKKDEAVYVALVGKEIVGFVCPEIKKTKAGHKECWITDLGIKKGFRRLGLAHKLLKRAYLFGNKNKVKYFFLESGYTNHAAHSLFKREGFTPLNTVFIKKGFR